MDRSSSRFEMENGEDAGGVIAVDAEGNWTHGGQLLTRTEIVTFFLENLCLGPDGRFAIRWKDQCHPIQTADTPFIVVSVDRESAPAGGRPDGRAGDAILLTFRYLPDRERLDPSTLRVGPDNVLYCRIRGGRFPARFSRPAYYQIAQWIEEDEQADGFALELNGQHYPVIPV